jgi:Domain of unknown function (DUF1707)
MADPADRRPAAAGGRCRLRASHADREQVIELLKDAFVQGRLAQDELDTRVGQALASRTYAELAALTADIPGGPAVAPPPRQPARAQNRAPGSHTARDVAIGLGLGLGLVVAILPGGLLQYAPLLLIPAAFILLVVVPCVVLYKMAYSSPPRRSHGQLPPRPGQGGQASEVRQLGQVGHDPAPSRDRADHTRADHTRADLRTDSSRPGRPRSSVRGARTPHGIWSIGTV